MGKVAINKAKWDIEDVEGDVIGFLLRFYLILIGINKDLNRLKRV